MKIGILREGKIPPDKRVPLTPRQCRSILNIYPNVEIVIQPSDFRCIGDDEYRKAGIPLSEDLKMCDVILGVKEVPVSNLIPDKTYLFFSHTIKKQPYNKGLLQQILKKNIRLVDYELLTDSKGMRLIGFGRYAGLVGAYNGLLTYGKRLGLYELKPAHLCSGLNEMKKEVRGINLPPVKIAITGNGRVATGAVELMEEAGVSRLPVTEYLYNDSIQEASYVQLTPGDYNRHKDGKAFELLHFFKQPEVYVGNFRRFLSATDLFISAAFWDPKAPVLFTQQDMLKEDFRIKVIADITCDINGSIPSTQRAATIAEPIYDYSPVSDQIEPPLSNEKHVTVMAVDNLPCELPKDASVDFGSRLMNRILPFIIGPDREEVIKRATIAVDGHLTKRFIYLSDYVAENYTAPIN
ncbi:alanine dehydrogenase [Marinilabiliaceae bacterium JC017]|nr:alanine dehydrogenase [Marinilabiliaceae bacterium JC017]